MLPDWASSLLSSWRMTSLMTMRFSGLAETTRVLLRASTVMAIASRCELASGRQRAGPIKPLLHERAEHAGDALGIRVFRVNV